MPAAAGNVSSSYQQAIYSSPYPEDGYLSDRYVRSIHRPVRVIRREAPPVVSVPQENLVPESRVYSEREEREVIRTGHGRSKKKSLAIVAGSAAGGAAIGALAGGGKGAGIGALAGGGAGFIYDRLTHDHHR